MEGLIPKMSPKAYELLDLERNQNLDVELEFHRSDFSEFEGPPKSKQCT